MSRQGRFSQMKDIPSLAEVGMAKLEFDKNLEKLKVLE